MPKCKDKQRNRSHPFSHPEVVEIVSYLDSHGYEDDRSTGKYKNKTKILKALSKRLFNKFGHTHNKRQIQKRYSDLKAREIYKLGDIRKSIALGSAGEGSGLLKENQQTKSSVSQETKSESEQDTCEDEDSEESQKSSSPDSIQKLSKKIDNMSSQLNSIEKKIDFIMLQLESIISGK